jgi:predicted permease
VLLTQWLGPALWTVILPDGMTTAGAPARLGWVAAGVAGACALVMTLVPAVFLRYTSDSDVLRSGSRSATRRTSVTGEALLLVQVALTVVLLVGAGLFVRSMLRLGAIDLGMKTDRVVAVRMNPDPSIREQAVREAIFAGMADAIRELPGVEVVGMSQTGPFLPSMSQGVFLPGHDALPGVGPDRLGYPTFFAVTPDFFESVGLRILEGRNFTAADDSNAAAVMLVDATMAATFWPGEAAIGRCVRLGADSMPCTTVVGVVQDSKRFLVQPNHSLRYYLPIGQSPFQPVQRFLLVRTTQSPSVMIHPVRTAASSAGGARAFADVFPLNDLLDPYTRQWRLGMAAFVTFGVLATLIATIGLYGVISFGLANREREFGIRRALGEPSARLLGSVMLGAALRSAAGLVIGGVLALLLERRLHQLLYQPSLADAVVFLVCIAVVMTATVVASAAPSWRAVRVDPITALRAE